jgi:hypothetical protein
VPLPFSEIRLSQDYSRLEAGEEPSKGVELVSLDSDPSLPKFMPLVTKTTRGKDTIDLDSNPKEMAILAKELMNTSQEEKVN